MDLLAVAARFCLPGAVQAVVPYGTGNVNDTFLVTLAGRPQRYLLQRLNSEVFREPQRVMDNLRTVAGHMRQRLDQQGDQRWEILEPVACDGGGHWLVTDHHGAWRLLRYIESTFVRHRLATEAEAREVGHGLARFHGLVSDLAPAALHDTLPGFHVTPGYLARYEALVGAGPRSEDAFCRRFIGRRRALAPVLEVRRARGELPLRVIHGDPKVDNFLLARESGQVVSLVDQDTVKPGLVQYDLGDCLRSCCNPAGEEAAPTEVEFDTDCCRALLEGYLGEAAAFLTDHDYAALYDAVRLIAFELGLRFYSDYLAGNPYFKVTDPEHNLRRALVQFRLVERIEAQEGVIRSLVEELR